MPHLANGTSDVPGGWYICPESFCSQSGDSCFLCGGVRRYVSNRLHVYIHAHMFTYADACVYIHVWRPEDKFGCHYPGVIHLVIRNSISQWSGAHQVGYAAWLVGPRDLPVSTDIQARTITPGFLYVGSRRPNSGLHTLLVCLLVSLNLLPRKRELQLRNYPHQIAL